MGAKNGEARRGEGAPSTVYPAGQAAGACIAFP